MIRIKSIDGFSKQGKRDNNEDYVLFNDKHDPDGRFIVLCDGMGGHAHGEVASQTVANTVFEYLKSLAKEEYETKDLQDALDTALSALTAVDMYDDKKSMGTTLAVVIINKMNVLVGHVGDSRCYLFDENGIMKFRTKDHSKVAEAIEAEILTEEEAFENSHKNILTRCVMSGRNDVKIDVDLLQIENNDRLLLCSDGVNDAIRDKEIEACMINRNVEDALKIINELCSLNSRDNYSAIIADLMQDEQNPIDNKSITQKVNTEQTEKNGISCLRCGEKNESYAKYCRKCGTKLTSIEHIDINSRDEMENHSISVLQRIFKKVFPLFCFLLGCLLSGISVKIFNYQKDKERLSIISKYHAKEYIYQNKFK